MKIKIVLFLMISISYNGMSQEFDRKYDKGVDLKKIEKKVKKSGESTDILDETSSEATSESKTNFDFGNMNIDGNYKAPTGFFITGKKSQVLQRMINLRDNFKDELEESVDLLPSLVK